VGFVTPFYITRGRVRNNFASPGVFWFGHCNSGGMGCWISFADPLANESSTARGYCLPASLNFNQKVHFKQGHMGHIDKTRPRE
jgi:hypothetical protein